MFLILRLFNSFLFLIANSALAINTLHRFFRSMKLHNALVKEVEEFNELVDESRSSLHFVGEKIKEGMKEMESDIGKEVLLTHNLTKLSTKISSIAKRFNDLEEGIIELARLSHDKENATVETPTDINDEVRKVLHIMKLKSSPGGEPGVGDVMPHQRRPRSAVRRVRNPNKSEAAVAKSPASPPPPMSPSNPHVPKTERAASRASRTSKTSRTRSPGVVPEVTLLEEQRRRVAMQDKPIGFRPAWMCEV